jgi:endonuclease-3 related protein
MKDPRRRIAGAYETLLAAYGPQSWWPSEGPFETMVGAVLTQHASWRNAERAIDALRARGLLRPEAVVDAPATTLTRAVRHAGSYRRKSETIRALAREIAARPGGLDGLLAMEPDALRNLLLGVRGVGPETADAMVLYAARRPSFVVDAYTFRFAERHGLVETGASYDRVQALFESALPCEADVYGECHALIVRLGKERCRPTPRCAGCPLEGDLPAVPPAPPKARRGPGVAGPARRKTARRLDLGRPRGQS